MKKILSILLATLMLVSMPMGVFAAEEPSTASGEVITVQTPENIIEMAQKEIVTILASHLEAKAMLNAKDGEPDRSVYEHEYSLGNPISVQELGGTNRLFEFPVMMDGRFYAIFIVHYYNDDYNFQLGDYMMADQLQKIKDQGSLQDVEFSSSEDGFFAIAGGTFYPLTPDSILPDNRSSANSEEGIKNVTGDFETVAINISNPLMVIPVSASVLDERATTSKVLSVTSVPQTDDGTFTGTQMNWCGAAVTAAIINYKKGTSLTAKSVTIEALGSAKDEGITNSQVVTVANNHKLYPSTGNPLSYSYVQSQINASQPIYMQMQRTTGDGEKKYHALGLIGYSSSDYTVINPWNKDSLTIKKKDTGSDVTYVTGTRTYTWYKSVSGWK